MPGLSLFKLAHVPLCMCVAMSFTEKSLKVAGQQFIAAFGKGSLHTLGWANRL